MGKLRYEEYKGYLSEDGERWEKDFLYRDAFDEALTEFEEGYLLLYHSIATHYADGTPKGAIDFLKDIYTKLIEESNESSSIKSSKFNYLIEEETK